MHNGGMIEASHIKAARAAVKESQAAFGARFGVDQSTIHRWETDGPPRRPLVQNVLSRALKGLPREAPQHGGTQA